MVSSNHFDRNVGSMKRFDGCSCILARRIQHGHETNKLPNTMIVLAPVSLAHGDRNRLITSFTKLDVSFANQLCKCLVRMIMYFPLAYVIVYSTGLSIDNLGRQAFCNGEHLVSTLHKRNYSLHIRIKTNNLGLLVFTLFLGNFRVHKRPNDSCINRIILLIRIRAKITVMNHIRLRKVIYGDNPIDNNRHVGSRQSTSLVRT
mmetsp:Transcript_24391/g.44113  ORF Transcript_24391/g.44113 Transcript_24391/m.44113 type:complete len:203 (+) Transcript_24391:1188-1796(+)